MTITIGKCENQHCRADHKRIRRSRETGRLRCEACRRSECTGTCCHCGKDKRIAARTDDGIYCDSCYKEVLHLDECSNCHKKKTVHRRIDGQPLCEECAPKPKIVCRDCGELKANGGGRRCPRCYKRQQRKK